MSFRGLALITCLGFVVAKNETGRASELGFVSRDGLSVRSMLTGPMARDLTPKGISVEEFRNLPGVYIIKVRGKLEDSVRQAWLEHGSLIENRQYRLTERSMAAVASVFSSGLGCRHFPGLGFPFPGVALAETEPPHRACRCA
jgi:hypothetical protein